MAADHNPNQIPPSSPSKPTFLDIEAHLHTPHHHHDDQRHQEIQIINYAKRAQWLRAAVLGANDGLLSTASLMTGVGAVRQDVKTMILAGVAGLVGGACSMAIGEFVSVYSQYDIELAQLKREGKEAKKAELPNPFQAAAASAAAFVVGAVVPLLGAAFVRDYRARMGVVVGVVSIALVVFGGLGGVLGKAPLVKSCMRVLVGGWVAMGVTFGLTKCVDFVGVSN